MNFTIATILIVFIVAMAGCTSPSPTSPSTATVSPTAIANASPTDIVNASPTPAASPTATVAATAALTNTAVPSDMAMADRVSVSDISIDWDTTDTMQHDTIHLKVKNNYKYMLLDVDVVYTVSTQGIIVNPDNTSYTQNQTSPVQTIQLGAMNTGEVRDVTIQSDHRKNVPAYIKIGANWREGSIIAYQGMLNVSDHAVGTKTF